MRLVIATCEVDYAGRLSAHLPKAKRLLLVKNDGSVLVAQKVKELLDACKAIDSSLA